MDINEIANTIYNKTLDMDANDYTENKEHEIAQLEEALYQIKAIAENDYNQDYWRTFWNALQLLQ